MPRFEPSAEKYTLYGADFSLYTCKLRSYLRKKGLPFRMREATLWTYRNFIIPRTGVSFIPVLQTPDDSVWQDTTVIIDYLEQKHPSQRMYPDTPRQRMLAFILELFGDEYLLISAMRHRWGHVENEVPMFENMGRLGVPWLPVMAQRIVGKSMATRFRGYLPALGITERTNAALDAWYEQFLVDLNAHLSHSDFLLGPRPSIADFGFAGPFCGHLAQDPWPARHLSEAAPAVVSWVDRMNSDKQFDADWPADDAIAPSLIPVAKHWSQEHLPILQDSVQQLASWAKAKPADTLVGRRLGEHTVLIAGVSVERTVASYPIWMYQRPYDYYHSLSLAHRVEVDELLWQIGAPQAFQHEFPVRLRRRNNRLYIA